MGNNFSSNITRPLARVFLDAFESVRVMSKNVNTQLLAGKFDPSTGSIVDFKRPTDYVAKRTSDGDISAGPPSDIVTGKASGVVQDYITVDVAFGEVEQALEMDQLDELLAPMAQRIVTTLELDFAQFMMKNSGLLAGTPGLGVSTWDHVAEAGAVMQSGGVPMDSEWIYAFNPFSQTALASNQRSLGSGGVSGELIKTAHEKATVSDNFAGMRVMTATTLGTFTSGAYGGDLAGVISSIDITYPTAKDTMTQAIGVTGIGTFSGVVPAGTVVRITGRNRLNLATRQPVINAAGANIEFTAVVTADSTFSGGAGTLIVSGPAIFEVTSGGAGAYNTTDTAVAVSDVISILGSASTLFQPNLFWHKQAFSIGSVPIKKLFSTDTLATTKDGLQIRVSKFSDGLANKQIVRFDLHPAYGVMNPFFAGQGFGTA